MVTGGGTGGHVYPALEVARQASSEGIEVAYFGSLRGMEGPACEQAGLLFHGFPSEPLYSFKTPQGIKAGAKMVRAIALARKSLKIAAPQVVFSTGGYASAPVVTAARSLKMPIVVHEQNSVPGRTNLMAAKGAYAVATTFMSAESHFPGCRVTRTGLPVRAELRALALAEHFDLDDWPMRVLVFGGSQGAAAINEAALATATRMTDVDVRWTHLTGKAHFEKVQPSYQKLGLGSIYEMHAFLEGEAMGAALQGASMAVSRSGAGTLSELAAFRLPAVLVPFPQAHANHQKANAQEFRLMGAASVVDQEDLVPAVLEEKLREWMGDPTRRQRARVALRDWDKPDAAKRIVALIRDAVGVAR